MSKDGKPKLWTDDTLCRYDGGTRPRTTSTGAGTTPNNLQRAAFAPTHCTSTETTTDVDMELYSRKRTKIKTVSDEEDASKVSKVDRTKKKTVVDKEGTPKVPEVASELSPVLKKVEAYVHDKEDKVGRQFTSLLAITLYPDLDESDLRQLFAETTQLHDAEIDYLIVDVYMKIYGQYNSEKTVSANVKHIWEHFTEQIENIRERMRVALHMQRKMFRQLGMKVIK